MLCIQHLAALLVGKALSLSLWYKSAAGLSIGTMFTLREFGGSHSWGAIGWCSFGWPAYLAPQIEETDIRNHVRKWQSHFGRIEPGFSWRGHFVLEAGLQSCLVSDGEQQHLKMNLRPWHCYQSPH